MHVWVCVGDECVLELVVCVRLCVCVCMERYLQACQPYTPRHEDRTGKLEMNRMTYRNGGSGVMKKREREGEGGRERRKSTTF